MLLGKGKKMYFDISDLDFSDLKIETGGKVIDAERGFIKTLSREAKPYLHKVSEEQYRKIKKRADFSSAQVNENFERNLVIAGLWLHAVQDRWAHGLRKEGLEHGKRADSIMHDWGSKNGDKAYKYMGKYADNRKSNKKSEDNGKRLANMKKLVRKNKRFNNMLDDTYRYLKRMRRSIKTHDKTHFSSGTGIGTIKNQVARRLWEKGW